MPISNDVQFVELLRFLRIVEGKVDRHSLEAECNAALFMAIQSARKPGVIGERQERIQGMYMGETAKALADVFAYAADNACVLLFDEFDSFGGSRQAATSSCGTENNRSLNVLLQLMERHRGPALIVACTNLSGSLDVALPRRFDAAIHFPAPTDEQRRELIRRTLGDETWTCDRGSHAEVVRDAMQERKRRVLARLATPKEGAA